jgi:hypothetical protein
MGRIVRSYSVFIAVHRLLSKNNFPLETDHDALLLSSELRILIGKGYTIFQQ